MLPADPSGWPHQLAGDGKRRQIVAQRQNPAYRPTPRTWHF